MSLELVSIETGTYPLDGAFYRPEAGTDKGTILIMHGNCGNFYTGVPRHIAPLRNLGRKRGEAEVEG